MERSSSVCRLPDLSSSAIAASISATAPDTNGAEAGHPRNVRNGARFGTRETAIAEERGLAVPPNRVLSGRTPHGTSGCTVALGHSTDGCRMAARRTAWPGRVAQAPRA
eukprot:scaffold12675_cov45-Phaeocystis_antarctica.AAC.1